MILEGPCISNIIGKLRIAKAGMIIINLLAFIVCDSAAKEREYDRYNNGDRKYLEK